MDQRTPEEEVVDISPDDEGEVVPFTYTITSYGADYPVDGLVKRLDQGSVVIPQFQRSFIWKRAQADRFIESLLLGLPVPGIFLALEEESRKLLVVDGQQRLTALRRFYAGTWEDRVYSLRFVQDQLKGRTYATLEPENRRRLDDSILHATVVRQDQPSEDQSSIYFLFERLNTGGTELVPQEIRNAIYSGAFRDLLEALNDAASWRTLYGHPSTRYKDRELILRFFAFRYWQEAYARPMKTFLNRYMARNRNLQKQGEQELRQVWHRTTEAVASALGHEAFRPGNALNAAIFDAVMVGVAARLEAGPIQSPVALATAYDRLVNADHFVRSYSRATADEENVRTRMELARSAFADVS